MKAKVFSNEGEIFVISGCCKDVVKDEKGEDYPSISLDAETLASKPTQEIPAGKGKCDWCDQEQEVPAIRIKVQG